MAKIGSCSYIIRNRYWNGYNSIATISITCRLVSTRKTWLCANALELRVSCTNSPMCELGVACQKPVVASIVDRQHFATEWCTYESNCTEIIFAEVQWAIIHHAYASLKNLLKSLLNNIKTIGNTLCTIYHIELFSYIQQWIWRWYSYKVYIYIYHHICQGPMWYVHIVINAKPEIIILK